MIDENQLRQRLFAILAIRPIAWTQIAKEIGITTLTLRRFVNESHPSFDLTLLKITKWVNDNEQK